MVRKRLSKHKIKKGFTVVFSPETVDKNHVIEVEDELNKKTTVGTISYMPGLFGMFAASHVIRKLAGV
jgi:tRNA A37 threonylcarbamoyladenosine dehydratase